MTIQPCRDWRKNLRASLFAIECFFSNPYIALSYKSQTKAALAANGSLLTSLRLAWLNRLTLPRLNPSSFNTIPQSWTRPHKSPKFYTRSDSLSPLSAEVQTHSEIFSLNQPLPAHRYHLRQQPEYKDNPERCGLIVPGAVLPSVRRNRWISHIPARMPEYRKSHLQY